MKRLGFCRALGSVLCLAGSLCASNGIGFSAATRKAAGPLPLFFTARCDGMPGYELRGVGLTAKLSPREVVIESAGSSIRIRYPGAGRIVAMDGIEPLLTGARASSCGGTSKNSAIPAFSAVRYRSLYPGIDMVYRVSGLRLKSEFILAPGADPALIQVTYPEAVQVALEPRGALEVKTKDGELREEGLQIYQGAGPSRIVVSGRFRVNYSLKSVGFQVGDYDRSRPLVIDPAISFSTYLGGSGVDVATAVAVDGSGNIYVTGYTDSADLPLSNAFQWRNAGGTDAFVAKFDPTGSHLAYCTYLGGSGDDRGFGVAVDGAGSAYITGWTTSTNFPATNWLPQPRLGAGHHIFAAKLNPSGNQLMYSTVFGGAGSEVGRGIAVDISGNAYIAGETTSAGFPTLSPVQATLKGQQNGFVIGLDTLGRLLFSTFLGGSGADGITALAVDHSGNIYLTGSTNSADFPMLNAFQRQIGGNQDAFVAKLGPGGRYLAYSTYLGGKGGTTGYPEIGLGIDVDATGSVYVVGVTSSPDFPVKNAFQTSLSGWLNAFLSKLSPAGNTLAYSTYLGSNVTFGNAVRVDPSGRPCVAGYTAAPNLPTLNPVQPALAGSYDAFLTCFAATGNSLVFSTYLGGSDSDAATGLALGTASAQLVGQTASLSFPLSRATQTVNRGGMSAFVASVSLPQVAPLLVTTPSLHGGAGTDLLVQDQATGAVTAWFMSGSAAIGQASVSAPTDWRVPAVGDFNGDGKPDIIWQHPVTGELWVWFMNGPNWMGQACISGPTDWRVVAVGDFNGDGKPDIIWQHPVTGELWVWFMNGSNWMGQARISGPTDWRVVAVGDFNADGKPDIIWQHPVTGELWVWFMNGSNWMGQACISGPTDWRVPAVGDLNGDGKPDILWQYPPTGDLWVWWMSGSALTGGSHILGPML